MIAAARDELLSEGREIGDDVAIGVMIGCRPQRWPAVLARHARFFSIGTND